MAGARARPERVARRVLLVGWDGAAWGAMRPLSETGELPQVARLSEREAIGELAGIYPRLAAPAWTSIASGVRPDRHGVFDDVACDATSGDWLPTSCRSRTAKALWNIASQAGRRSVVVHWAVSAPAEPIRGTCVDERFSIPAGPMGGAWPVAGGSVHPPARAAGLADLRVHPAELAPEEMEAFLPHLRQTSLTEDPRPLAVADAVAECATVHAVATELLEREPWDLAAIRYPLLGRLERFARFGPTAEPGVSGVDAAKYGRVVPAALQLLDAMLGRLRELAGPDTVVILVSDRDLLAIGGCGVRRDQLIHGAGMLDIAPTVLALMGIDVGADMPGRVLAEAFEEPPADRRIPSWEAVAGEDGRHPPLPPVTPWESSEAVRQLVELGYAPASAQDDERTRRAEAHADFTRAVNQMDAREWAVAAESFRRAAERLPDDPTPRLYRAACLLAAGDREGCRAIAAQERDDPKFLPYAELILGMVAADDGQPEEALRRFLAAGSGRVDGAFLHSHLADAYLRLGRLQEAERAVERARDADPNARSAPFIAAAIRLAQGRPHEAVDEALRAVAMQFRWPEAHHRLGVALAQLGRLDDAIRALETSIAQGPSSEARATLASVLARVDWDVGRIVGHRAAMDDVSRESRA